MKFKFSVCCSCTLALFVFCVDVLSRSPETIAKPRVIVLTDISSLLQKEAEPDDGQSMIRLMLYTNDLDIEGLIATSNLEHGQRVRPELIKQVVEKYGEVRAKLLLHDDRYPPAEDLFKIIYPGQPIASPTVPVFKSIGEGKDTKGSEHIIRVVDKNDSRPVWILIWGGSADLAQALWKVKRQRSAEAVKKFVSRIRVDACGDQDATGPWIRKNFPDLYYVFREEGIRGMYRGGDTTLVDPVWIKTNMRGHGALGELYVEYDGGDVWSWKIGKVKGIKEGDSPITLSLLNNGLNAPEHKNWGSWGGRFKQLPENSKRWVDDYDSFGNYKTDPDIGMSTIYRWRKVWQADFESRLDWCIKPFDEANHAPVFDMAPEKINVHSGDKILLQVKNISDPDRDDLKYRWFFYPEAGSYRGILPELNSNTSEVSFICPETSQPATMHVLLEVSDSGKPPSLVRYKRFILQIENN